MKETVPLSVVADVVQHAVMAALLLVQKVRQVPHAQDALQHVKEAVTHHVLQLVKVLPQIVGVQIVQTVVLLDAQLHVQGHVQEDVVLVVQKRAELRVPLLAQVAVERDVRVDVPETVDQVALAVVLVAVGLVVLAVVVALVQAVARLLVLAVQEHVLGLVNSTAT